jgi:hypothetical protein
VWESVVFWKPRVDAMLGNREVEVGGGWWEKGGQAGCRCFALWRGGGARAGLFLALGSFDAKWNDSTTTPLLSRSFP